MTHAGIRKLLEGTTPSKGTQRDWKFLLASPNIIKQLLAENDVLIKAIGKAIKADEYEAIYPKGPRILKHALKQVAELQRWSFNV